MAKKAASKRKRYSEQEKAEIIGYVNEVNSAKGRGGVAAAVRKYKASPISINSWIKKSDTPVSLGGGRRRGDILDRLVQLRDELATMEAAIVKKRAEFEKLKRKI